MYETFIGRRVAVQFYVPIARSRDINLKSKKFRVKMSPNFGLDIMGQNVPTKSNGTEQYWE